MNQFCPDICPMCKADLKSDGYPVAHQADPDGEICLFEWDVQGALEAELLEESRERPWD